MLEIINDFIGGLLLSITALIFAMISLNKKITKSKLVICLVILFVSTTYPLVYNNIDGTISSFIHSTIIAIMFVYLFNVSLYKGIFMAFVHALLLLVADICTIVIPLYIFKVDKNYLYNVFAGSILSNTIVCIVFILLLVILRKPLQKLFAYEISSNIKIAIFSTLSIICVWIFFYIGFSNLENNNALLVSVFGMLVFLTILFSLIKQKIDNNKITEKYDSLIEFMNSYEEKIDELRIQSHENKNQLLNIKSKIIDKDKNKNIIEYIDSILNEKVQLDKGKYSKLKYLPSNGFKGMFYYKISKAEELGIKISINISAGIKKSVLHNMNAEDYKQLCRIIGVYLDNAIEASAISNEKLLGIEIYLNNNDVEIIISNSYLGEVDINNIYEKGYSTKGKSRGYGLSLVKNILENSNIFSSETTTCNGIYTQKLNIKGK